MLNQIVVEDCLTFPVNLRCFRVLVLCSAATKDCRLTWDQSGVQENVFGKQFPTLDSPRDFPQRSSSDDVQRNREAAPGDPMVKTSLTSEDGQIMAQLQCRCLRQDR